MKKRICFRLTVLLYAAMLVILPQVFCHDEPDTAFVGMSVMDPETPGVPESGASAAPAEVLEQPLLPNAPGDDDDLH